MCGQQLAEPRLTDSPPTVDLVDTNTFSNSFEIVTSNGDGWCFLYSLLNSHKFQLGSALCTLTELIDKLRKEVYENRYMYAIQVDNDQCKLVRQMNNYFISKKYDSRFGDLLPVIAANALDQKLSIVHTDKVVNNNYRVSSMSPEHHDSNNKPKIHISRTGKHYDALKPIISGTRSPL